MAAASSSSPRWNYDVFLSFRGEDTRKNIVDHLYMALQQGGIYAFKDDEKLKGGNSISPELLKAIKESRIAIIVFSKDYASSSWCLDELVEIIGCKSTMGQTVLPVFYNVDPSDIRNQKGSFAGAFAKHEEIFGEDKEKVQRWRAALVEASNLSGWNLNNIANGHEAKFIQKIVQETLKELGHVPLNVAEYEVGINSRVNKVITLLENGLKDVQIVGICGTGGIGKTTIAKAVFNQIFGQFENCHFLGNVKECSEKHGLTYLQRQLLNGILMEDLVDYGINVIKKRLRYKKVLVVLDDVDHVMQLKSLVGGKDWFGFGSRIIVTTRDERLLVENKVDHTIYRVELLNNDEALQLFSWHAFTRSHPVEDYLELSWNLINYAQGLPLALQVLGSFLFERSIEEWEHELDNLKRIPNRQIHDVLKISYDGLNDTEKDLFLDIACFFKGYNKDYVMDILSSSGFHPRIAVLIERSLITISSNELRMHDLIQEMGKEIVRQESADDLGKRSRLWFHEDIYKVLKDNTATETIKGIMLNMPHGHLSEELHVNADVFTKMKKLKLLNLSGVRPCGQLTYLSNELSYLVWDGYPASFLPSNFHPQNLVILELPHSQIKQISMSINFPKKLKILNLRHCPYLDKTPDLSSLPCLENLDLEGCRNLVKVHLSSGVHDRLVKVNLYECKKLRCLPRSIHLKNLKYFYLSGCSKLERFPEIQGDMDCLEQLNLGRTGIKDLPSSIEHLHGLRLLTLTRCQKLKSVPSTIFSRMKDLQSLYMGGTAMKQLPSSIVHLSNLQILYLSDFQEPSTKMPRSLMPYSFLGKKTSSNSIYLQLELPLGLCSLTELFLKNCNLSEESFPTDIGSLSSLKVLDVSENSFVSIPANFIQLTNLSSINLEHCRSLRTLTSLPSSITYVYARGCKSLERFWIPPRTGRSDLERQFIFTQCHKLVMEQGNNKPNISSQSQPQENFLMVFPGTEIPHCFSHKIEEEGSSSVCVQVDDDHRLPSYNNVKGIAVCAALELHGITPPIPHIEIDLKINGYSVSKGFIYESDIVSNHTIFTHRAKYYDEDEMAIQPIKNLMNKKPELSTGPPNVCDDGCYIQASIFGTFGTVIVKKWGIHLVMEEDQTETSEQGD